MLQELILIAHLGILTPSNEKLPFRRVYN